MKAKFGLLLGAMLFVVPACGDDTTESSAPAVSAVLDNYGTIVHQSYLDSHDKAVEMKAAIDAFVAAPSADGLEAAKAAWLAAREPYGQTEAYRFYDGPIDREGGPEGQLNAWPLDERFIDYVEGKADSGIVNDPSIEITKEKLASLTEGAGGDIFKEGDSFDGDKAISTGYHAIEFLLWGQDQSASGPGTRPYTDFLTGADATAPNGDRRGLFLQVATELLIDDLKSLVGEWEAGQDNFRKTFVAGGDDSVKKIITAIGMLSKGELGGERMDVGLQSLDQEDEHSCFSDNTHVDIKMNALGVENSYLGRYGSIDGPGIDELVEAVDPAVNTQMKTLLTTSLNAIDAMPIPFDQAIAVKDADGWVKVDTAVKALFAQGDYFVKVAETLGYGTISIELPE